MLSKIAFFDSGIGGLTVLQEALHRLPNESFIYFADSDNAPYGTKTNTQITELVLDAADFLARKNIKALVLACNTATSVVVRQLRQRYTFPVIGMEPAVKPALKNATGKKVLVCATDKTLKEEKLSALIQQLNANSTVDKLSLQHLVMFAEKQQFDEATVRQYLMEQLGNLDWNNYEALVLGCTHFNYFRKNLRTILPENIAVIDGNVGTVEQLKRLLPVVGHEMQPTIEFYQSKKRIDPVYFKPFFDRINCVDV